VNASPSRLCDTDKDATGIKPSSTPSNSNAPMAVNNTM